MVRNYSLSKRVGNGVPVFVDGIRSAFVKSFGLFEDTETVELYSRVVDGLMRKLNLPAEELDEITSGVVIPQTKNPNVARDTALQLGMPAHIHGYTLNRACTSSLQTTANAAMAIKAGIPQCVLAGGVECLSDVPIVYSKEARKFLVKLSKAKSTAAKLNIIKNFKAKAWLPKPPALSEPLTGLTMGEHAEIMAKKNGISREDQDEFAVRSHHRAYQAQQEGRFKEEILDIWPGPKYETCVSEDNIIRGDTSVEAMAKLRPVFDREFGTLTAGNSSPLTDGASVGLISDEAIAKEFGLKPKLRIIDFDFVGIDPMDQLLIGPALTIPRILWKNKLTIADIDLFEIHEAFAAQVLSCTRSMNDAKFCEKYFGSSSTLGEIPEDKLNVNGGAIAIGHPFGATGTRLLTTVANELIRQDKEKAVIGVCAAGGMAASMLVERIN